MEAKDTVMKFPLTYEYYEKVRNLVEGITQTTAEGYAFIKFNEALEAQAEITWDKAIREVVEFVSNLIIGIDGCEFEERLDGDKGCIVLDMNENQWKAQQKEWRRE